MSDTEFNILLLAVDLAVLALVARSRRVQTGVFVVGAGLLVAASAALLVREEIFHLLRLCAYVVFAHTPAILFGIAWIVRARSRALVRLCLALALSILVVGADAFLIEPHRLELNHVVIHSAKVTRPTRIAVVSDLQTDRIRAYERRALELTLAAEPDLILMTGDYLQGASTRGNRLPDQFRDLLRETGFGAPLGAYATEGNTDPPSWPQLFSGSRITPFVETTSIESGGIALTALSFHDSFNASLRIAPVDRFHIAFGHAPDFAMGDVGADLLVAGHTHGGQVRLPFIGPIMTFSRVPRAWAAGVTQLRPGKTLVVSRGIGMERGRAPRLRFLCRPEIVIVDVLPQTESPRP